MSEVANVREVEILDMEDGKVTKVEIAGFDGEFVKVSEESDEEVVIEEDIAEVIQPKDTVLFDDGTEVRLLSGGGDWPLYGYEDGESYQVDSDGSWGPHDPTKVVRIVGANVNGWGFAKPEQLEVVENKDYAGNDCNGTALYVGDYVVGISSRYGVTSEAMLLGEIEEGEDYDGDIFVTVIAHEKPEEANYDISFPVKSKYFRKATAEEIAMHS
ncbi:hypothetical protein [Oceanobacillus neutriphilus]|uniref:Uncharacterized protein n=1 Tax=Oceanobacillus neutriphilus TaxID=531815 RepID=A0ABQ2NY71_9BACI|nr:hypothetical protein [Oceanobacillus neutriphilus]GGP13492.1 hypothetical protein GCM10011346_33700 [Oceanobacillus neutriphilus]